MKTKPTKRDTPPEDFDDGIPPTELARKANRRRNKPNHHVFQLCKQVRQSIDASIVCDCGDPLFDDLTPCWVDPVQGNSSNLLVTFGIRGADPDRIQETYQRLNQVSAVLRMAVAQTICRKKVPRLSFQILPVE